MAATLRIYIRDRVTPGLEELEQRVVQTAAATGLDAGELLRSLAAVRQRLMVEKPAILRDIGRKVLARAHEAFNVKSAGGTGADGLQWKPLTARYVGQRKAGTAIGVRSGTLRDPRFDVLDVHADESYVSVGFGAPHAEFFDEERPLINNYLPAAWFAEAKQTAQQRLDVAAEGLSR